MWIRCKPAITFLCLIQNLCYTCIKARLIVFIWHKVNLSKLFQHQQPSILSPSWISTPRQITGIFLILKQTDYITTTISQQYHCISSHTPLETSANSFQLIMGYKGPCCSINQSTEKRLKLSKTVTVFNAEFEKHEAKQAEDYREK